MELGAHMSTAGGLPNAIYRGAELGCEAIQIFASPPQGWAFKPVPEALTAEFREKSAETGIKPVFFHAIYLINLGTPDPAHLKRGIDSLVKYMTLASEVDAAGIIFHPGSHKGAGYDAMLEQTVAGIEEVVSKSPEGPYLALENTAGMGRHIGAKFEELGRIMKAVEPQYRARLKVCLDTQHSLAAGYDVTTEDGLNAMMQEFDEWIGLDNLAAVHANDSKCPLGGGIDRHQNIGEGYIGIDGFENIMAHPAFRSVPFFLEVPGFDNKGPDKQNLEILKDIRKRVAC